MADVGASKDRDAQGIEIDGGRPQPRLLLVDGHSLANRAFYALPALSTNTGVPTGAVFGFLTMLFRFLQEKKPTHVAIAFDHPSPTFRHAEYAEYKVTRKPSPPDFKVQIPVLKEALDTLNLPVIELAGFEADDIIGTLSAQAQDQGFSVSILSGDKDCLQLVTGSVRAILPIRGITQVREYDPETVLEDMGFTPAQVIDYKALAGDSSDNIPGVKGIGGKTAIALLSKFGSIDGIYENLDEVAPARVKRLLEEARDTALLSRSLATIKRDVPLPVGPKELEWTGPDLPRAKSKFTELEFYSLAQRLGTLKAGQTGVSRDERKEREEDALTKRSRGALSTASLFQEEPGTSGALAGETAGFNRSKAEQSTLTDAHGITNGTMNGAAGGTTNSAVGNAAGRTLEGTAEAVVVGAADDAAHAAAVGAADGAVDGEAYDGVHSRTDGAAGEATDGEAQFDPDLLRATSFPSSLDGGTISYQVIDTELELARFAEEAKASGQIAVYAEVTEVTRDFSWPSLIGVSTGGPNWASMGEPPLGLTATAAGVAMGEPFLAATGASTGTPTEGPCDASMNRPRCFLLKQPELNPEAWQEALWKHIGPLLVDPAVAKVGFDLKWLFTLCLKRGIRLSGECFDVLIASYLLDPTRSAYRLPEIARKYTQLEVPFVPLKAEREADLAAALETTDAHFAVGAASCFQAALGLKRDLEAEGLTALAEEAEFPLIEVLAAMEANGVGVNLPLGQSIRKEFGIALESLEGSIYGLAGEQFNLGSPKQLAHILFDRLGMKPVKKTKTGFSTDAEVLETLSFEHELPAKILEYRQYAKLKSTYLDVLEDVINPTTGRIHSTFHQTVTATGRLSSSEPNLQNIPVRGELGRSLRRIFVPAQGRLFLAADYSQIELRIMAHMANDPSMIEAFVSGEDIHSRTASEMFGVPLDKVDSDLRSKAKAVNFGVIYGISDFGLARNTGVSRDEAKRFIEAYFARYPMVKEFMDKSIESARKSGYAVTILGRKRAIPDIDSRIRQKRGFAERTAINTPIQGSAADIIKLAMVRIYQRLKDEELISRLILQVHDELIFEIPPSEESIMRELVAKEMEGVMQLKVPLKVDLDVGESWYDV